VFKHHKYFAKPRQEQAYLFPHVCFHCRKSFKKPMSRSERLCPQCAGGLVRLSRKFKAPPSKDLRQWEKVKFLVEHGFRFYSVYQRTGSGEIRVPYPSTLAEARDFVRAHIREAGQTPQVAGEDAGDAV
jgi:hypothetical protein